MNTPPRSFAAPPPSFFESKSQLRAEMRGRRRALKAAHPDAAVQAARAWAASGVCAPAVAAIYHAQGSEMDAAPLAAVLRERGAVIVLPVADAADAPLVFREARAGEPLQTDAAGVPAPGPDAPERRPDLVIAPLLAFDAEGGRLGQGGGFYDRTIAALRAQGSLHVFGLAYAEQEVARVSCEPHDARLDGVITEAGVRVFPTGRG